MVYDYVHVHIYNPKDTKKEIKTKPILALLLLFFLMCSVYVLLLLGYTNDYKHEWRRFYNA